MDIGLRPLSPEGEKVLDELESDYGVRARETQPDGERLYVIASPGVADHYERHLAGFDADWRSHVALTLLPGQRSSIQNSDGEWGAS